MNKFLIRNTDISVSKISFGTASLHKLISKEKGLNLLSAAEDIGISHFDTAPMYGYGYAENLMGEYLSKRRANFTVTTKIGYALNYHLDISLPSIWAKKVFGRIFKLQSGIHQDWSIKGVQRSLDDSLRRLKTDYIDFLLLHEPEYSIINKYEMINWLHDKKKQGAIREWGISGEASKVIPFISYDSEFCNIIQTRVGNKFEAMLPSPMQVDFSYGYFSKVNLTIEHLPSVLKKLREASVQDIYGSIIISSSRIKNILSLVE